MRRLSARDAYIARLEGMLGIVHRSGPDGRIDPKPLGESTPSSRILFKEKSPEEKRKRQGGAKPGHPGHGRRSVEPDRADRVRELPRPDECPDCGGRLLDFGTSSRTLRDCAPYRFRGTRSSSVAVEVFGGSAGTTKTDRCPGYDNAVPGKHQWCFEHVKRNFLELLKSEPDNKGRRRPLSERRANEAQTRMTESPRLHRPYP